MLKLFVGNKNLSKIWKRKIICNNENYISYEYTLKSNSEINFKFTYDFIFQYGIISSIYSCNILISIDTREINNVIFNNDVLIIEYGKFNNSIMLW